MKKLEQTRSGGITRRHMLKGTGLALGGAAIAASGLARGADQTCGAEGACTTADYQEYVPDAGVLDLTKGPLPPPGKDELRVTFLGSGFPPPRPGQKQMSVFVEVGPSSGTDPDQFVFDCGSGVVANYVGMGITYGRMDKIFINHLHGDHMGDLATIYCFGPAGDRKKPLYVWGPGPSGVQSPRPPPRPHQGIKAPSRIYDDGTKAFCRNFREACRWHTESFSFLETSMQGTTLPTRETWGLPCDPVPVGDDPPDDGYALVPIELDWRTEGGVAYHNRNTGVRITHFPVVHSRRGSVGYKLEWNGRTVIYTSDTRPERASIRAASGGAPVDLFIHEMNVPPEIMAMRSLGLTSLPPPKQYEAVFKLLLDSYALVWENSHTTQGAFGYLLSQIEPYRPRLAVATHFPIARDTVECAFQSVQKHVRGIQMLGSAGVKSGEYITWSNDFMVLTVSGDGTITQQVAKVNPFVTLVTGGSAASGEVPRYKVPKYWTWQRDASGNVVYVDGQPVPVGDPHYQNDLTNEIQPGPDTYCESGY